MPHSKTWLLFRILMGSCILMGSWPTSASADFPELFNSEPESTDQWLSPADAASGMTVPDGFRVSAFAAEPDVQNPIACTWDSRGRLWVAENYTYAERTQQFQLDLRDRVLIFDGTDQDQFETRKVFTDDVQMLTGIEVGRGGVWLMCPPKLIFIPDADKDDVPDSEGTVVLDGFEVADANYHNFANGLRFGPDGWLYGRCGGSCPGMIGTPETKQEHRLALEGGLWRYHPDTERVEALTSGTTNPWGHDWNDVGEPFFVNTVNGHLWHGITGAHFTRPFTLDPNGKTYELIDFHADHWHFDTGGAWHQSRDGAANSYGGGHAHCGTMIYQGGLWPKKYHNQLFTLNFHGRRANQEILNRSGSGYLASHAPDFFLAADPWFRGMEITSGPMGNAFVLDWSDAGECHEHTGVHRTSGRIFKISYAPLGANAQLASNLTDGDVANWSETELAGSVLNRNAWFRRQSRIELADRAAQGDSLTEARTILKALFEDADSESTAVQALLSLYCAGETLLPAEHPSEYVRAWAVRLATNGMSLDDAMGPDWKSQNPRASNEYPSSLSVTQLAKWANDESLLVRLAVASSLQRLPVADRSIVAQQLCGHSDAAADHNLPLMIWYGLIPVAKESPDQLVAVAKNCQIPTTLRLITRSLAEQIETNPQAINALLTEVAASSDEEFAKTVLTGIAEGLKGRRKATAPSVWPKITAMGLISVQPIVRELSVVFGDGRAMDELTEIALGKTEADFDMRQTALATLIQSRDERLRQVCTSLLGDARMNVLAAQGLANFDDPEVGKALVKRYRNFRAPNRPQLMSILVSRKTFAMPMLDAIDQGKIKRADLTVYQVRQLTSLQDDELNQRLSSAWGEVQDTPEAIRAEIEKLKSELNPTHLATADRSNGRALFANNCQNCHKLYGEGQDIGPDLTGANRGNIDYLLDNIVSPSSVVDKDFRMTLILLDDDRIVSGLVTSENDQVITIQTATEVQTVEKDRVEMRKMTEKSPMPDGLLSNLSPSEVRDLIGYLQHPSQVSLP